MPNYAGLPAYRGVKPRNAPARSPDPNREGYTMKLKLDEKAM